MNDACTQIKDVSQKVIGLSENFKGSISQELDTLMSETLEIDRTSQKEQIDEETVTEVQSIPDPLNNNAENSQSSKIDIEV